MLCLSELSAKSDFGNTPAKISALYVSDLSMAFSKCGVCIASKISGRNVGDPGK